MNDAHLAALCADAYTRAGFYESGDVSALRLDDGRDTYLALRGTRLASPRDVARDLQFWPRYAKGLGWCHDGFLSGAQSVAGQIIADMAGRRVTLTGHSLGGAMAACLAGMLTVAQMPPRALVTFGAPRVTWDRRLRWVLWGARIARRQYHRPGDDVPDWAFGCGHVARRIWLPPGCDDPIRAHEIAEYEQAVAARSLA